MLPLLIWAAAVAVVLVAYFLGPKAMLVGFVLVLLAGMRAIWRRPAGRR